MKKFLLMVCMAAVLTACGGGSGSGGGSGGNGPPMSSVDAFFSRVLALIGASSDNAEPVAIDTVTPTAPEDSEPSPLS